MEKVIRFNRDEQRAIVRGLYDMRNAMEQNDPQKRELNHFIPSWNLKSFYCNT